MKEATSPYAKIVDPFAEKEGGFDMGNLAKSVLAGLGIHSAIDFLKIVRLMTLNKINAIKMNLKKLKKKCGRIKNYKES